MKKIIHNIAAIPLVYDAIQSAAGMNILAKRLETIFSKMQTGETVLDLGAGTAIFRKNYPQDINYIWSDLDFVKYEGAKKVLKDNDGRMFGDATQIPLASKSVDYTVCVSLSHHLNTNQLKNFVSELSRVTRKRTIFVDGVRDSSSFIRRLAWEYDRGSHPRNVHDIEDQFQGHFSIDHEDILELLHQIHVWQLTPKDIS